MIVIRPCKGLEELQACVDLQVETWGYCEGDVIPRRMFLVAQKIGGQVIGAFQTAHSGQGTEIREQRTEIRGQGSADSGQGTENREQRTEIRGQGSGVRDQGSESRGQFGDSGGMVGFAFSLPGVKTGDSGEGGEGNESYLHSHMLAVKEGYRNRQIGAQLKLAQRREAMSRGIRRIEWTFDPLEIKNAFLNIHKLGAIIRRYEPDFYGVSSSRLQGGLPTDRLVAEWWLASPRAQRAVAGSQPPVPGRHGEDWIETIRVPAAIYEWKANDNLRHLAAEVQAQNRASFQKAFSQGLAVIGFSRDQGGDGVYYLGSWRGPED